VLVIVAFHVFKEGKLQVRRQQYSYSIGSVMKSSKQLLYAVLLCWTNMPDLWEPSLATVFECRSTARHPCTHPDQSIQLIFCKLGLLKQ
jgi:hypothetical protein